MIKIGWCIKVKSDLCRGEVRGIIMVLVRLCGAGAKPISSLSALRPLLSSPLISSNPQLAPATCTTSLSTEPAKPTGPNDRLFGLASNIAGL